jgi:hypothetical protein
MLAKTLETIEATAPKRALYMCGIFAVLALTFVVKIAWFSRVGIWHDRDLVDFDVFHIVAQKVWLGGLDQVYQFANLLKMQQQASNGHGGFLPWTYPPQFDLLLAPFGLIPTNVAYFLFTAATFAFYVIVLRFIARSCFVLLLVVLFPIIGITIACGQNGFLTGGLIGLICLYYDERPIVAGLALGLMVIKPHLAVAFAAYAILNRSWIVVATSGAVVLASSAVCTAIFGGQIWTAFFQSVQDSSVFLEQGQYPLFRMISVYAALRTSSLSAWTAFLGQGIIAVLLLGLIPIALYRRLPTRSILGLTAAVSVCISPYAYDYDLLIFGVGLAMLLPALYAGTSELEREMIYASPMIIGAYGSARSAQLGTTSDISYVDVFSIGGFVTVASVALMSWILMRGSRSEEHHPLSTKKPLGSALR